MKSRELTAAASIALALCMPAVNAQPAPVDSQPAVPTLPGLNAADRCVTLMGAARDTCMLEARNDGPVLRAPAQRLPSAGSDMSGRVPPLPADDLPGRLPSSADPAFPGRIPQAPAVDRPVQPAAVTPRTAPSDGARFGPPAQPGTPIVR